MTQLPRLSPPQKRVNFTGKPDRIPYGANYLSGLKNGFQQRLLYLLQSFSNASLQAATTTTANATRVIRRGKRTIASIPQMEWARVLFSADMWVTLLQALQRQLKELRKGQRNQFAALRIGKLSTSTQSLIVRFQWIIEHVLHIARQSGQGKQLRRWLTIKSPRMIWIILSMTGIFFGVLFCLSLLGVAAIQKPIQNVQAFSYTITHEVISNFSPAPTPAATSHIRVRPKPHTSTLQSSPTSSDSTVPATFLRLKRVQDTPERSVVPASQPVAMARGPLDQPPRFGLT